MARYIHYNENEDDTISLTLSLEEGEEMTFIIPLSMDEMMEQLMSSMDVHAIEEFVCDNVVYVPNSLEGP